MHPVRKQRLIMVVLIVILSSAAVGLVTYFLSENINLFYPPSKIVAGEAPTDTYIRAGGCVLPGSVKRNKDNLQVVFIVTDGKAQLEVEYEGILPDLFAEGEAAVVKGRLDGDGVFQANQVLAKHDENYMPPEVADAVQSAGEDSEGEKKAPYAKTCDGMNMAGNKTNAGVDYGADRQ